MSETPQQDIKTFSGNKNLYVVIGKNGAAILGCHLSIAEHPANGHPYLMVRFAGFDTENADFDYGHFTKRDHAEFLYGPETVTGFRLNRILIPLFDTSMSKASILLYGDKFQIWDKVGGWIVDQLALGGFLPTIEDFADFVRSQFTPPPIEESVQCVLALPTLTAPKALPVQSDDDDEDESDDANTDEE